MTAQPITSSQTMTSADQPILELKGITKRFPGVVALDKVSFDVQPGEVHALLGENGAGKSTLMKVLAGKYQPEEGSIHIAGTEEVFATPMAAKHKGVLLIHQELSLVDDLTVAENIFLGSLPQKGLNRVDWTLLRRKTDGILQQLNCSFGANDPVGRLSIANKQMVEIGRALVFTPKVVIFDEPTASLTDQEKPVLFNVINNLKQQGVGIVYISHRMDEIFTLSQRISVLRDGTYQGTVNTADTNEDLVTRMMIGRSLERDSTTKPTEFGERILELKNLSLPGKYADINLTVRAGEIVGMYGLIGAGRTEIADSIFGIRTPRSGEIWINGQLESIKTPTDAVRLGVALVPESRKEQGLIPVLSCRDNMSLSNLSQLNWWGFMNNKAEMKVFQRYHERLKIKTPNSQQKVNNLSGGNQQKIVIGKWLSTHPKLLILDEPTRGIDVGSKAEIHALIKELAKSGYAVLVISSEMPEVLNVSNRIIAMYSGRITAEFDAEKVTEDGLIQAITGMQVSDSEGQLS